MTLHKYTGDCNVDINPIKTWNFHCWNEIYIRGLGLYWPEEYDGWCAIDATPQREFGKMAQCGPAPKTAILNGNVTKIEPEVH